MVELLLDGGVGLKQIPIFTAGNETIYLSGGGGFHVGARYLVRMQRFEYSGGIIFALSTLSRELTNADATFRRFIVDPQLKLLLKLKDGNYINPSVGLGIHFGGQMDIDAVAVAGQRQRFKYGTAVGYFLAGEYEYAQWQNLTLAAGLRYYNVRFDVNSARVNNIVVPPQNIRYEIAALDGSGIDLMLRLRIKL